MAYLIVHESLALLLALGLDNTNRSNRIQLRQVQLCLCVDTLLLLLQVLGGGACLGLDFLRGRALDILLAGLAHAGGRGERRGLGALGTT